MAHEIVYGICENLCKVRVYAKSQVDTIIAGINSRLNSAESDIDDLESQVEKHLLWTNESFPTSAIANFNAQTISLGRNYYKYYLMELLKVSGSAEPTKIFIAKGVNHKNVYGNEFYEPITEITANSSGAVLYERSFNILISSNGVDVKFRDCNAVYLKDDLPNSIANSYLIPKYIYGIEPFNYS